MISGEQDKSEDEDEDEEDDEYVEVCSLCGEALENQDNPQSRFAPVGLHCRGDLSHIFHRECIDHWMSSPSGPLSRKCPLCFKDPVQIHRGSLLRGLVQKRMREVRNSWIAPSAWMAYLREASLEWRLKYGDRILWTASLFGTAVLCLILVLVIAWLSRRGASDSKFIIVTDASSSVRVVFSSTNTGDCPPVLALLSRRTEER